VRTKKIPIVAGIQRFDESVIPNDYNISAGASARATDFQYITATDRRDAGPEMVNMIIWGANDQTAKATQRPPIKAAQNNISASGSGIGRGIFRDQAGRVVSIVGTDASTVKVNDGGFLTEASTTITGTLTSSDSHDKVYIAQSGPDELAIVDHVNDKLWKFDLSGSGTMTEVADVDVPADLARGCVVLNNKVYYGTKANARIYNTASGDITSQDALDFISVERQEAELQMIESHHDHIVAFTDRSIEFFYDNANPNGSPLRRRQDLFYTVGCVTEVTRVGDTIYFIGKSEGGDYGLYKLEDFRLEKISDERSNYKIEAMVKGAGIMYVNGLVIADRHMICIIQVNDRSTTNDAATPDPEIKDTVWFDVKYGALYSWDSASAALQPDIVATTSSNMAMTFQGTPIYFKGLLSELVQDDTNETQTSTTAQAITWLIRMPSLTMGTRKRKFWKEVDIDGSHQQNLGDAAIDIDFYWSDDFYETNTIANKRTIDFKDFRFIEKGLGSSRQRAFYLGGASTVRTFLENMNLTYSVGT